MVKKLNSLKQPSLQEKAIDEIRHHLDILDEYRGTLKKRLRTSIHDKHRCLEELEIIDLERERLILLFNNLTARTK